MSGPSEHRTPEGPGRVHLVDRHGPQKRRPIAVLCVEDDADDAHLMGRHLAALGGFAAEVAYAPSLSVARAMLDRHRFDVVICDFWLGDSTSIPLIDQIRLEARACPVVLVSSLENDDIELIGRRAGAAGFVAKADLSAHALERVFVTLLAGDDARPAAVPGAGVGPWLRALLRSLDRVHAASTLALASGTDDAAAAARGFLSDIVANSSEIRSDVIDKLAGLERATRRTGQPVRFDVVPFLADAERLLRDRAADESAVSFLVPAMPLLVESSPSLFGDLMQGFFAQALDAVARGDAVTVAPSIEDGCFRLDLSVRDGGRTGQAADERVAAAADTRRFLVETLAKATGGSFTDGVVDGGRVAHLSVPLRAALL
ncbi:response regulator [Chthonobacter albigriseus]|uniref:response regulator n=1 Tax=Chthonobacter albigriseus TaxID=1683161 RepID=UPI0015EF4274|nr:response regulator [Chthonobacter albigriseus]